MTLRFAHEAFVEIDDVRAAPNCGCVTDSTPTDADLQEMIDAASDAIALVTGMRIAGRRELIARPCRDACHTTCRCCQLDAILLGEGDITIGKVKVDGVELDPATYALHPSPIGWNLVKVSTDTNRPTRWPMSQALWKPDTETDTFAVYFTTGFFVDHYLVQQAALEVVCDFAADSAIIANALDDAVTTATIGNVTITLDDDRLDRIRSGRLGPMTSRMMGILAPGGNQPSTVWAPELVDGWDLNLRVPA